MFDLAPERDWDDEPSEEEIRYIICELQRALLQKYPLTRVDELTPLRPRRLTDCKSQSDITQYLTWADARKCLETSVFTAKLLVPERYFCLFEALLTDWMPEIN